MVAQMLEVGPCIRALGDAAGSAVSVLHIVGYPGGACHGAPVLLKPALLERLSRPTVDDHRPDALIRWHALELRERQRIELKINIGFLAGLCCLLDQDVIMNVLPQQAIRPAWAKWPLGVRYPLAYHIDLPQRAFELQCLCESKLRSL